MPGQTQSTKPASSSPAGQFFGQVRARQHWQGNILSRLDHTQERKLPAHEHALPYFSLILRGRYEEEGRRGFNLYEPFTIAFHPLCTRHTGVVPRDGVSFFTAEISESWLDEFRGRIGLCGPVYELRPGELSWLALRLFSEFSEGAHASQLNMESLTWEMLGVAARMSAKSHQAAPSWWHRVIERLHGEFRCDLHIGDLAAEAGVHPVYFARIFRRLQGQTAGTYVHSLRVQYACRHLGDRDLALCDIAADAGFADQSHMTRIFRRVTGTTPAALRQKLLAA